MLFGVFDSPEKRLRKRNKKHFENVTAIYEGCRLGFRDNAISKLTFMNPDMKFLFNTQCGVFAGLEPEKENFLWGYFDDDELPDLCELEEKQKYSDFPNLCRNFVRRTKDYRPKRFSFLCGHTEGNGYFYFEGCFIFEILIAKNGKAIARSNASDPKPLGYFRRKLYEHVVQDTSGTGASTLKIVFYFSNYSESASDEVYFAYQDPPRKDESQSRPHYMQVCSLFLPFLEAGEQQLRSHEFEPGGQYSVTNWDQGDDSEVLGSVV